MNRHESESWAATAVMLVLGLLILVTLAGGGAFWLYKATMRARMAEEMAVLEAEQARMAEEMAKVQAEHARRAEAIATEAKLVQATAANPPSNAAEKDFNEIRQSVSDVEDTWRSVESDGELTDDEKTQMRDALEKLRSAVGELSP